MFCSRIGPRTDREKKEDEAFMVALREIQTLQVRDGCMSMDVSDLKTQIENLHEVGKRLVSR